MKFYRSSPHLLSLREQQILIFATNIHYKFPIHTTMAFKEYGRSLPRTEYVCDNILSLPCYFSLPQHQQDYIVKAVKEFYAKY